MQRFLQINKHIGYKKNHHVNTYNNKQKVRYGYRVHVAPSLTSHGSNLLQTFVVEY